MGMKGPMNSIVSIYCLFVTRIEMSKNHGVMIHEDAIGTRKALIEENVKKIGIYLHEEE